MPNRLRNFLGKRPIIIQGVSIYSPTIDSIDQIGEVNYNIFLMLATFNKEAILKYIFNVSNEDYEQIHNEDSYIILTSIPAIVEELEKALSFFLREEVRYDLNNNLFSVNNGGSINASNYEEIVNVIREQNGITDKSTQVIKFKNEKARQMYSRLQKLRVKYKKSEEDSLGLKDMLSILCNAEGNGINVFNVHQLTIYQVYEHFERLNIKEQHTRLLRVWANGYLGENEKLPEWIVRSKL